MSAIRLRLPDSIHNRARILAWLMFAGGAAVGHAAVTLTPTHDGRIPDEGTLVYCPTFLAVWVGSAEVMTPFPIRQSPQGTGLR
jgi:hypothetical protein